MAKSFSKSSSHAEGPVRPWTGLSALSCHSLGAVPHCNTSPEVVTSPPTHCLPNKSWHMVVVQKPLLEVECVLTTCRSYFGSGLLAVRVPANRQGCRDWALFRWQVPEALPGPVRRHESNTNATWCKLTKCFFHRTTALPREPRRLHWKTSWTG